MTILVNTADELGNIVSQWGSPTISCCVTNNASNMISGIEKVEWNHLPCFAHTLNLVVQDSIKLDPLLRGVKEKGKSIVAHFHRSTKSHEKLRSIQEQLNLPQLKLIQDFVTRWNSTYLMLERLNSQHKAVTTTLCLLGMQDMCFTADEKQYLSQSLILLKPFLPATEEISGEKYVSVSMIIPLYRMLLKATTTGPDIALKEILKSELLRRFAHVEQRYTMAVSTLLDSRFKKLAFADTSAVDNAARRLTAEVQTLITNKFIASTSNNEEAAETEVEKDTLWASFDTKVTQASSHRTDGTDAFLEIKRYFETKVIERKSDPLLWWRSNGGQFPHVMEVAQKYLAIPGSTVPSERLFSKAGELVSQQRSCLKHKTIDMIFFKQKLCFVTINLKELLFVNN